MKLFLRKSFIVLIFCSIGCFLQLSSVTWDFFRFKVRTEITYSYPKEIVLPEIDLVIPMVALINMSELYLRHKDEMTTICQLFHGTLTLDIETVEDFDKHCSDLKNSAILAPDMISSVLTIGDVQQLTKDPREMIEGVYFDDLINDLVKAKICHMSRHMTGLVIFLRISCRNNSMPIVKKVDRDYMGKNWILCIRNNIYHDFGFRFAAPDSKISSRLNDYSFINPKRGSFNFVSANYRQLVSESLPWPFETNCTYYDRSLALTNCINENLLALKPPRVFAHSVLPFNKYPPEYKFLDRSRNIQHDNVTIVLEKCQKMFEETECQLISYHVSSIFHTDQDTLETVLICLEPPHDPLILHKSYPESSPMDYIVYVSSILGIWFGISVYEQLNKPISWCKSSKSNVKEIERMKVKRISKMTNSIVNSRVTPFMRRYNNKLNLLYY